MSTTVRHRRKSPVTDKYKIDSTKLMYHPHRAAQTLDAQNNWELAKEVYPIYIEVSPLSICNHACSFCGVDYARGRDQIDLETFRTRVAEMGKLGVKSVMFAGEGEPLLHKDIVRMVTATRGAGIDVAFTTNGVPMTQKFAQQALPFVEWVKVSFNAGTPETYAKIHRTKERDFHTVVENIKYAVKFRREHEFGFNCSIGMQMVLLDENAHEVEDFLKLAKSLNVDYAVIKSYSQHKFSDTHIYENIDYSKYLELEKTVAIYSDANFTAIFRANGMVEKEPYDICMSTPNLWAYIDSKMDVYACSAYLLQDRFNLGSLKTQTFQDIWHGDKRKALFEEGIDISECRKNCRMDNCNRYLSSIKDGTIQHVNFI